MKFKFLITTLIFIASVGMSNAQKFAYVDVDYVLQQLPEYRSSQNKIDQLSETWQKEINAQYLEIEQLYKDYQAEKILLSKAQQQKREEEIIAKEKAVKKFQSEKFGYEGELFKKRQQLIKPIQDKVYEAIKKVSRESNLDFIFDKSGQLLVLYSNPKYDKSGEVLEELGVVIDETKKGIKNNLPPQLKEMLPNNGNLPKIENLPPR